MCLFILARNWLESLTPCCCSERVLGLDSFETAQRYANLSVYLHALRRFAEAWLVARRALLLYTIIGGPKHPELASLHITLSNISIELRDANGMIHHANEALKIRVDAYGDGHEIVGDVHHNTAFLYHRIGRSQIASRCAAADGDWIFVLNLFFVTGTCGEQR